MVSVVTAYFSLYVSECVCRSGLQPSPQICPAQTLKCFACTASKWGKWWNFHLTCWLSSFMKNNDFLWGVCGCVQVAARSQAAPVFHHHVDWTNVNLLVASAGILSMASSEPSRARRRLRYLCKVSDVKQVEGLEQLALSQVELAVTSGQKRADIFQAQELKNRWKDTSKNLTGRRAASFPTCFRHLNMRPKSVAHVYAAGAAKSSSSGGGGGEGDGV